MIIFRYLYRELLASTFAVCVILLLILISGRFVKYLSQAVVGYIDPGIIFAVIGYRVPDFLELTLPLAFFLAILLTFGRLYVENEMSVLKACGISEGQLLKYTLSVAMLIALLVAWLSLAIAPSGAYKYSTLLVAQKQRSELDKLMPNTFYPLSGGKGVVYAESIDERKRLSHVFLAMSDGEDDTGTVLVLADHGVQKQDLGKQRALILSHGYRIEGIPGQADYQLTEFAEYGARLAAGDGTLEIQETDAIPSSELFDSEKLTHMAALQWRLSLPIMVLVVTLLAVPLSRTNPRQGRFSKLLPAVLLYFTYLITLNVSREAIEDGRLPGSIGVLPVHAVFLLIAVFLLKSGKPRRSKNKPASVTGPVT